MELIIKASLFSILLAQLETWAFIPVFPLRSLQKLESSHVLFASSSAAQETLNRARRASGMEELEEEPKLFDDSLLEDMKQSLLTLEKRTKEGPGSLSLSEVQQFEAATKRILADMKVQAANLPNRSKPGERAAMLQAESLEEAKEKVRKLEAMENAGISGRMANMMVQAEGAAVQEASPTPPPVSSSPAPEVKVIKTEEITDTSQDEGPKYVGKGGLGQPQGTRNTYVIEGMDEMTPDEFQKALQESIIAKQQERRKKGMAGNYGTLSYMNQLTGGGPSPLKQEALDRDHYAGSADMEDSL